MDLDEQFESGHLLFQQRTCRVCGETKDLTEGFYKTRKTRGDIPSAYSYECKECTIKRIMSNKKSSNMWEYPDW